MAVGRSTECFDSLVGTRRVLDRLGAIQQEVEQAVEVGFGLGRELDLEGHLRSCFTLAATFASSFDRTTSDETETPVRS